MAIHQGSNQTPEKPDRRQSLILAAYHAIAEKGFEGLRVRDVAAQVGINGATLHHYFATKEALIQAVMEYVMVQLRRAGGDLTGTPAEQLHLHLNRVFRLMQDEPALFIVLTEMNLRAQRDPTLHYLTEQETLWHGMLVGILQAGIDQQQWSARLNPVTAASAIITLMEGASLWAVPLPERSEQVFQQLEQWLLLS